MAFCVRAAATPLKKNSYIRYAEKVNGRAAMQGMLWGAVNFAHSHTGIVDQLKMPMNDLAMVGVVGAVAVGTAFTHDVDDVPTKFSGVFSDEVETLNAQVAMASFPLVVAASQILA